MDLNEKLAARRRELAIEAEKTKIVEKVANEERAVHQKELAIEAEKAKKAEQDAINAEVSKRLAEQGIAQPAPVTIPKSAVDAEVEKALSKAASDRMTSGENTKFTVLLVLGLISLFVAWPMGVGFIVWAMIFISKTTARYKEQIIAEGKSNISKLQETRLAAEQGNDSAQNNLSDIYAEGKIVQKDLKAAFHWLEKAALAGLPIAQANLGWAYMDNYLELAPDYPLAMEWSLKAANQGSIAAAENIALLYENGWGVPVNHAEAENWRQKVTVQKSRNANLERMAL